MNTIKLGDKGNAVEDVQQRLALISLLDESDITGVFDEPTALALAAFCRRENIPSATQIDDKVWSALVDATYSLGDRTLYLRMPYFHGHDVRQLQQALGALGFAFGVEDAIFGASTEHALRRFQLNLGLPSDGIAGAYTYAALRNLQHSWEGKSGLSGAHRMSFARAADVLEKNSLCLFGTDEFTRSVASRMSNLALATNPLSRIVSAEALSVAPDACTMFVEIACEEGARDCANSKGALPVKVPEVVYSDDETLIKRMNGALQAASTEEPLRMKVILPGTSWMEAGPERTAQHYAITLLDALCAAL